MSQADISQSLGSQECIWSKIFLQHRQFAEVSVLEHSCPVAQCMVLLASATVLTNKILHFGTCSFAFKNIHLGLVVTLWKVLLAKGTGQVAGVTYGIAHLAEMKMTLDLHSPSCITVWQQPEQAVLRTFHQHR